MKYVIQLAIAFMSLPVFSQVIVNPDGTHLIRTGSVIVNPNGSHSTVHETGATSVIVNPNGTHSTLHGSVLVNPDGTHSTRTGSVIVNPDGTHSVKTGSVLVNPDGSHTILPYNRRDEPPKRNRSYERKVKRYYLDDEPAYRNPYRLQRVKESNVRYPDKY